MMQLRRSSLRFLRPHLFESVRLSVYVISGFPLSHADAPGGGIDELK
jgi:hypothetical protein